MFSLFGLQMWHHNCCPWRHKQVCEEAWKVGFHKTFAESRCTGWYDKIEVKQRLYTPRRRCYGFESLARWVKASEATLLLSATVAVGFFLPAAASLFEQRGDHHLKPEKQCRPIFVSGLFQVIRARSTVPVSKCQFNTRSFPPGTVEMNTVQCCMPRERTAERLFPRPLPCLHTFWIGFSLWLVWKALLE